MTRTKRKWSKAKRDEYREVQQEKVNELKAKVDNALDAFLVTADKAVKSEVLRNYLATMSRFHNYSFRNMLLILSQNPEATHVAGFKQWKEKFNRHVKKGEHGIAILYPSVRKRTARDGDTPERVDEEGNVSWMSFRVGFVFDVSQTEGDELPTLEKTPKGGDHKRMWADLTAFAESKNIKVTVEEIKKHGCGGSSHGGSVTINKKNKPARRAATLAHELAHELLHHEKDDCTPAAVREVEAECVAYAVCSAYGIEYDGADRYVAGWSSATMDNPSKIILKSLERIRWVANILLGNVEE